MGARPGQAATRLTDIRPPSARPAAAIALVVLGGYALAVGPTYGGDTISYVRGADALIERGFDIGSVVAGTHSFYPPLLYILFGLLVALLKLALGPHWGWGLLLLNLGASILTATLLVSAVWKLTRCGLAAWCALALFLGSVRIVHSVPFLLSDSTFLLLAMLVFTMTANRLLRPGASWWPVFALAFAAALYRPTGVVLVPAVGWAWLLSRSPPGRIRQGIAVLLTVGAMAAALLFIWLMQDPARWPFAALSEPIAGTAAIYARGEIVHARPETWLAPPATYFDYVGIALARTAYFFAPFPQGYSLPHKIVEAAFFIPVYAFSLLVLIWLSRGRHDLSRGEADVLWAALGFLLITASFHGLIQVDAGWRYRMPVLPHLVLLASAGIALSLRQVVRR